MPQDPLLVDQVQIEPGSAGLRLIRRATDGSLEFFDSVVTGGITLSALAGLSIGGVMTVGKSGAGAEHSTIQAALDCIPATSGPTEPYVILIGPGVYNETINIVRDWVFLVGLGGAVLEPLETVPNGPGAYHTVVIQSDLGTTPEHVVLQDLVVRNYHNGYACVRVVGGAGSTVGNTSIDLVNCDLQATAVGGNRPLWATSVNNVNFRLGTMAECNGLALILVAECVSFVMTSVVGASALQLDYNAGGSLPATAGSAYRVSECPGQGLTSSINPPFRSTLLGGSSLSILNCGEIGDVTVGGNRSLLVVGTDIQDLSLVDTTSAKLIGSGRDSVTFGAGTSLEEALQTGTATFTAEATKAVTLPAPHPDNQYSVAVELDGSPGGETPWVTAKTTTGFTLNFDTPQTLGAAWTVARTL
jgi:hypothetical protein